MKNEKTESNRKTKAKRPKCASSKKKALCVKKTGCDWVDEKCISLKSKRADKAQSPTKTSPKKKKIKCEWVSVKDLTQDDKKLLGKQAKMQRLKSTRYPSKLEIKEKKKKKSLESSTDLTKPLKRLVSPLMKDIESATKYVSKILKTKSLNKMKAKKGEKSAGKKKKKKNKLISQSPARSRISEKLLKKSFPQKKKDLVPLRLGVSPTKSLLRNPRIPTSDRVPQGKFRTNLVLSKLSSKSKPSSSRSRSPAKLRSSLSLGQKMDKKWLKKESKFREGQVRSGMPKLFLPKAAAYPSGDFSQRFASFQLSKPVKVEPYEQTKLQKEKQLTKRHFSNHQRFSPGVRYPVSPYFDRESRLPFGSPQKVDFGKSYNKVYKFADTKPDREHRKMSEQKRIHDLDILSKLMDIPEKETHKLAYRGKPHESPRTFYELENVVRNDNIVRGIDDVHEFKNMPVKSGRISNYSSRDHMSKYVNSVPVSQKYLKAKLPDEGNQELNFKIKNTLTKKRTQDFFAEDPSELIIPTSVQKKGSRKKIEYEDDFDRDYEYHRGLIIEIPDHDDFVNYDRDSQIKRRRARKSHGILIDDKYQQDQRDPLIDEKFSKLFNTVMQEKKKKSFQI